MAIVRYADTRQTLAGLGGSFNHTQQAGTAPLLLLIAEYQTNRNITVFTYNGVAATFVTAGDAGNSRTWAIYQVVNPTSGLNAVQFTIDANPTYASQLWVCSFTGASGIVQASVSAPVIAGAVGRTHSINGVLASSAVYIGGIGNGYGAALDVELPDGTDAVQIVSFSSPIGFMHYEEEAVDVSGTVTGRIKTPIAGANVSMWLVEIGEDGGGGGGPILTGNFFQLIGKR